MLVAWGANEFGQLGLQTENPKKDKVRNDEQNPVNVPFFTNLSQSGLPPPMVKSVACGTKHSIFLTEDGIIFGTGDNSFGQLGVGDVEKVSRPNKIPLAESVRAVAAGDAHNLAVTDSGRVFCWGLNDKGQCGKITDSEKQDNFIVGSPRGVPNFNDSMLNFFASLAAAGAKHSLVLSRGGNVFSFGDNSLGQLGIEDALTGKVDLDYFDDPIEIDSLTGIPVFGLACGDHHSVAWSRSGAAFAWGCNKKGQLGLRELISAKKPTRIERLASVAVKHMVCGAYHTVALSLTGNVYAFGSGSEGALGSGSREQVAAPQIVKGALAHAVVTQVAAGRSHSLAYVESSGMLYGFGCCKHSQLGVEDTAANKAGHRQGHHRHMLLPTPTSVSFLSHAQAEEERDPNSARKWSAPVKEILPSSAVSEPVSRVETPDDVTRPSPCSSRIPIIKDDERESKMIFRIFSGGGHNFALVFPVEEGVFFPPTPTMAAFTRWRVDEAERLEAGVAHAAAATLSILVSKGSSLLGRKVTSLNSNKMSTSGESQALCSKTYPSVPVPIDIRFWSEFENPISIIDQSRIRQVRDIADGNSIPSPAEVTNIKKAVVEAYQSLSCINGSFLDPTRHNVCHAHNHGIDIHSLKAFIKNLQSKFSGVMSEIYDALTTTLFLLEFQIPSSETARVFIVVPETLVQISPRSSGLLVPFGAAYALMSLTHVHTLLHWYDSPNLEKEHLATLLVLFQAKFNETICKIPLDATSLRILNVMLEAMKTLKEMNKELGDFLTYDQFYLPEISRIWEMSADFFLWRLSRAQFVIYPQIPNLPFHFCDYPFVLDGVAKATVLQADAQMQMLEAATTINARNFEQILDHAAGNIHGPLRYSNPNLVLTVRRQSVLEDTITAIEKQFSDTERQLYKRPLVVIFSDEEAVDNGGVRKEFFMLLFKEIMDQKFGMFRTYQNGGALWFNPFSFEEPQMFRFFGMLCGLAIYNSVIIPLSFPLVLYKLMLEPSYNFSIEDIDDVDSTMADSLRNLLNFEETQGETVEETFFLSFQVMEEQMGKVNLIDLKENGEKVFVDASNREEYVEMFLEHRLRGSVKTQLEAFRTGFLTVCGGDILTFFHPLELMETIVGSENFNFDVFEEHTVYMEPFAKEHTVVKWFWEVFHGFNLEQKRKFLLFLTASDRVPVQGMIAVEMTMCPTCGSESYYPVAHTCINRLDLPIYSSKSILETRLLVAIEHIQGFGLV